MDLAPITSFAPMRLRARTLAVLRDLHARVVCRPAPGQGPLVVFMPAGPASDGAVRLRVHEIACALGPHGWRTAVLPAGLAVEARRRVIARLAPDVLIMQGVRHPANRPHLYPGPPILLDIDDADFHLAHLAAPMVAALDGVAGVIAGSRYIADWAEARGVPARVVWTGTQVRSAAPPLHRGPVVAWAQTRPMTYLREADMVRAAMARVARHHPGTTLRLYDRQDGDDAGFAESFGVPGLTVEWRRTTGYARYLESFDDVAVGLAPLDPGNPFSRGKSFGKVLAYLDREVAVVASEAGEHRAVFDGTNGRLVRDPSEMAEATLGYLRDPDLRQSAGRKGRETLQRRLSIDAAAARLAQSLDALVPQQGRTTR